MSSLSPTAKRFIGLALDQHGDRGRADEWHAWDAKATAELPPHIAQVAFEALSALVLWADNRIADVDTTSADAARLENDLGYIADIEAVLSDHLPKSSRVYG
jgi:hypothetical protein